jgi:hypothetical protein
MVICIERRRRQFIVFNNAQQCSVLLRNIWLIYEDQSEREKINLRTSLCIVPRIVVQFQSKL